MKLNNDQIARRAYELWQQAGCLPGRDQDYWLQAERELLAATGSSAKPAASASGGKGSFANPMPITPRLESAIASRESRKHGAPAP